VKKEDNLGTDFRGGTEVLVRFQQNISIDEIRSALDKSGFIGADIKTAYNGSDILIRTSEQGEGNVISDKITKGLKSSIPNNQFEVLRVNRVGPKVNNMIENQIKVK
jgi:preprotein translocase subunit SecF